MAVPSTIPDGFYGNTNLPTGRDEVYDQVNKVATIPASYQGHYTVGKVHQSNQGITINTGPRSYWEHTIPTGSTTVEKLVLT
jgi:hypothetical protein